MKNLTSKAIYEKTNKRIESVTRTFTSIHLSLSVPFVMIPNLIISFFIYFTTNSGSEAFRMPFPVWWVLSRAIFSIILIWMFEAVIQKHLPFPPLTRLPFNWRTPFGYLIAFSIQYVTVHNMAQIFACYVNFFFGLYQMLMSLVEDIKSELTILCEPADTNNHPIDVKQKLSEFIEFHSEVKQLSKQRI